MKTFPSENGILPISRYSAKVVSEFTCHITALTFLGTHINPTALNEVNKTEFAGFGIDSGSLGPQDKNSFVHVMGTSMALGTITSIIFHVFFKYKKNDAISEVKINEEDISRANNKLAKPICTMTALDWFKEPQTYQVRN